MVQTESHAGNAERAAMIRSPACGSALEDQRGYRERSIQEAPCGSDLGAHAGPHIPGGGDSSSNRNVM